MRKGEVTSIKKVAPSAPSSLTDTITWEVFLSAQKGVMQERAWVPHLWVLRKLTQLFQRS